MGSVAHVWWLLCCGSRLNLKDNAIGGYNEDDSDEDEDDEAMPLSGATVTVPAPTAPPPAIPSAEEMEAALKPLQALTALASLDCTAAHIPTHRLPMSIRKLPGLMWLNGQRLRK